MSLETGSTEAAAETVSATESAVEVSSSGSGYSVTDPGYEFESDSPVDETVEANPSETLGDASGEEAAEETVKTPTVDEVPESEMISDELLDKAFELGYTVEELKKFNDVKSLEKEITLTAKLQERWQQRQAVNSPATESAAKPEDVLIDDEKPEPDWEELIRVGHDEDVIALAKANWTESRQTKAMLRDLVKKEQQRAFQSQCERFDDALNKIGDEFQPLFGTGSRAELLESSKEQAANRQIVFDKMNMLRHGYLTAGQRVPSEADLIQEAVHASFYKHAQTTARKKLTSDIRNAGSQALSRPNSGGEKPLSGPPKALQLEQDFWRKNSL